MKGAAVQVLINSVLPKELQDVNRVLDGKTLKKLLAEVGRKYPHLYKDISFKLKKIGEKMCLYAGASFEIDDFVATFDKNKLIDKELDSLKNKPMSEQIMGMAALNKKMETETLLSGVKKRNNLALMVHSASRGRPGQLNSLIGAPIMYVDSLERPIPIPIKSSFSEGLTPSEYFASAYGTRRGTISTIMATPKGGYFNKSLTNVAEDQLVTESDCKTNNGIKEAVSDSYNVGRLLAMPAGKYPKDTVLTEEILSDLEKKKIKYIYIRSPITCQAREGTCQKCFGIDENGRYKEQGYNLGVNSAAAMSEPFTQGAMSEKHSGGVVGQVVSKKGLELINQYLNIPKNFEGQATLAEEDGVVETIKEAPQGGHYIYINGLKHFVQKGLPIKVKIGQKLESGDVLSEGTINPADVVRLRNIGEGRHSLFNNIRKTMFGEGKKMNKVHMEVIAKSMINHGVIKDQKDFTDNVIGDVVSFDEIQATYQPEGAKEIDTKDARGKYLAGNYLFYTIGTKVKDSVIQELKEAKIEKIKVTDVGPSFDPKMIRMYDIPKYRSNWISRMYSNRIKDKILGAVQQGEKANIHGRHFVPSLIEGKNFGKDKINY
jgi:DNA-directed RNA polymerase subunit beta'